MGNAPMKTGHGRGRADGTLAMGSLDGRQESLAAPRSERPTTPHAEARRRRAPRPLKVPPWGGVERARLVGGAGRHDRERRAEPPRREAEPPSALVRTGRDSRRSTGCPASRSSASARSAQLSEGAVGASDSSDAGPSERAAEGSVEPLARISEGGDQGEGKTVAEAPSLAGLRALGSNAILLCTKCFTIH